MNGAKKLVSWNAAIYLLERGLSKSNFSHFGNLPSDIVAIIKSHRAQGRNTRVLRSFDWIKKPELQIIASKAIFIYQEINPRNASFEYPLTLSELATVMRILVLEFGELPAECRADHIYQVFGFMRNNTLIKESCTKCHSKYFVKSELLDRPCPTCALIAKYAKVEVPLASQA
ncbi:hypothetical protein [Pseudoalteromonas sp. T1lg23B]|uniref:hypothetical protein n=1 Tax=Pseudoalteromonas sp. T1lg23B TaxID=2077097 RepID=UPI000CF6E276|nr:hypothetical protein [Pseudoalteromonas sp. T1lg23B]